MGLFGKKKTPPPEPVVLLEQVCPDGNLQAVVESDGRTVFMYLAGPEGSDFGMRSVWVRNLADAPKTLDKKAMQDGAPPMNPAEFSRPGSGNEAPEADALSVVWLPEGNGVALKEGSQILAIIPPWSGENGFSGYSRAAAAEGPLAWPIEQDNALLERFKRAEAYWESWDTSDPWAALQEATVKIYEDTLGKHSKYFAIDGGEWPPKAIVLIDSENSTVLATVGVALRPQPNVERAMEDYRPSSRIELAAMLPKMWDETAVKKFASYVSGLGSYPWEQQTWLGHGHTIPCDSWNNGEFNHTLIWSSHPGAPPLSLPPQDGDAVNLLWFIPITDKERALAEEKGSENLFDALPKDRWRSS